MDRNPKKDDGRLFNEALVCIEPDGRESLLLDDELRAVFTDKINFISREGAAIEHLSGGRKKRMRKKTNQKKMEEIENEKIEDENKDKGEFKIEYFFF